MTNETENTQNESRKNRSVWGTIAFWFSNARYRTWKQSFVPCFLTLLLVGNESDCSLLLGLLATVGVVLAHWSANLLDDYFDYTSGCVESRKKMIDGGMRARSHKCWYLTGTTTTRALLFVALLFGAFAAAIGAYLVVLRGMPVVWCFLAGAFLAFFYSAPPFRLSFHGLGELSVSLLFGPILMLGVAAAACGRFVPSVLPVSCSVGLLVGNILYTHSVLDLDPDRRAGKKTLAVLLGNEYRAVWGSALFMLAIYASVVIGVYRDMLSPMSLLVFLSIPLAFGLWRLLWLHAVAPEQNVERAFWMGPMENWDLMLVNHLDWFMIRWFLSRNLMVLFCGLLAVSILLERVLVP